MFCKIYPKDQAMTSESSTTNRVNTPQKKKVNNSATAGMSRVNLISSPGCIQLTCPREITTQCHSVIYKTFVV